MRYMLPVILMLAAARCLLAAAADGPLDVPVPAGWKMEYQGTDGLDFYSVVPQPAGSGLLMFYKWPPRTKPEEIPALVRNLAGDYVDAVKKGSAVLAGDKREVEGFAGAHCKGSYVVFRFKGEDAGGPPMHAIFMMSADGLIWNGQFTGKPDDWAEALKLLNAIKKKN